MAENLKRNPNFWIWLSGKKVNNLYFIGGLWAREGLQNCKINFFAWFLHIFWNNKRHKHRDFEKSLSGGQVTLIEYGAKDNGGTKKWNSSEGKRV